MTAITSVVAHTVLIIVTLVATAAVIIIVIIVAVAVVAIAIAWTILSRFTRLHFKVIQILPVTHGHSNSLAIKFTRKKNRENVELLLFEKSIRHYKSQLYLKSANFPMLWKR